MAGDKLVLPWAWYRHQWVMLPSLPKGPLLSGKTLIVTGANSGVGLESIKQLLKYSPARLIFAVRSVEASERIAQKLRKTTSTQIDVWYLDLTKFETIKAFAEKANGLERLDVLMNNAGVNPNMTPAPIKLTEDGYERTLQTNVLGTLLVTLLLEPILTRTKEIKGADPLVVFTGSDGHTLADPSILVETLRAEESMMAALNNADKYNQPNIYMLSKLLLQMVTRSLITALPHIRIVNCNPGLSRTNLSRDFDFKPSFAIIGEIIWFLTNSRSGASGAKSLTTAVVNSKDSVDYWSECEPKFSESTFLPTLTGYRATKQVYKEFVDECEKIVPGCTVCLV